MYGIFDAAGAAPAFSANHVHDLECGGGPPL